jgi:hypothetical protein
MAITEKLLAGAAVDASLDALVSLRLDIFREYPYLYDGAVISLIGCLPIQGSYQNGHCWTIKKQKALISQGFAYFFVLYWVIKWCRRPGSNRHTLTDAGF